MNSREVKTRVGKRSIEVRKMIFIKVVWIIEDHQQMLRQKIKGQEAQMGEQLIEIVGYSRLVLCLGKTQM
jgi:hypothetical protein